MARKPRRKPHRKSPTATKAAKRAATVASAAAKAAARKPKRTPRRKSPLDPTRGDQAALDDARHVLLLATKYRAEFRKYDAKRAKKLFSDAQFNAFKAAAAAVASSMSVHKTQTAAAMAATANETTLRAALFALVRDTRDVVSLAHPNDAQVAAAVGVGRKLSSVSNDHVLSLAADQEDAFGSATFGPLMKSAGITQKHIDASNAAQVALSKASSAQTATIGTKSAERITKDKGIRELKKMTTRVRKVARVVFRGNARVLAEFAKRAVARRAPKPRAKKATAPVAPSTPPTTTTSGAK